MTTQELRDSVVQLTTRQLHTLRDRYYNMLEDTVFTSEADEIEVEKKIEIVEKELLTREGTTRRNK